MFVANAGCGENGEILIEVYKLPVITWLSSGRPNVQNSDYN